MNPFRRLRASSLGAVLLGTALACATTPLQAQLSGVWWGSTDTRAGRHGETCIATGCGPSYESPNGLLTARSVGFDYLLRDYGNLRLDSGLGFSRRGWDSSPGNQVVYTTVPFHASVGHWPTTPGLGASVGLGLAADLAFDRIGHSRLSGLATVQVHARLNSHAMFSVGFRGSRAMSETNGYKLRTTTLFVGFTGFPFTMQR